jgi:acetyltransferase-like isoleucine patch superfamily enzyme
MPAPASVPTIHQAGVVDVQFGRNVRLVEPVNLYGCRIGDDSSIGPFVEIQRGAVIGRKCRIQSHAFICSLVEIGDECFVGHGVMFVNDLFQDGAPAGGDVRKWRPTRIGNNVSIGSNATILPVEIVAGTVIGAGSVVTRSISVRGVYAGNPARLLRTLQEPA